MDLAAGHQVLVQRNPKPADGFKSKGYKLLGANDSLTIDTTVLPPGYKLTVRRSPKPAAGWIKDPRQTLTATATLEITALTAEPPPPDPGEPPPAGELRGFGKTVKRSTASLTTVKTLAELRTALGAGGKNIQVDVPAGTIWKLAGSDLSPKSGTTLNGGNLTLMDGGFKAAGVSDIFVENLRVHAGDQFGNAQDLDAGNVNGNNGPVRRVYFRNCQFLWGPDVVFAALGDISEVTFEHCVFAEGLYDSKHPEAPHALALNLASTSPEVASTKVSIIECLLASCESRNIRLIGVEQVEVVSTTIYNYHEGPQGCPVGGANFLACTWKKGPNALANTLLFRFQKGGHGAYEKATPNSVFVGSKSVVGFTDSGVDASLRASSPAFAGGMSDPGDAVAAHGRTLAQAGAFPADKQLTRIRGYVKSGGGKYVNGFGKADSYTALV